MEPIHPARPAHAGERHQRSISPLGLQWGRYVLRVTWPLSEWSWREGGVSGVLPDKALPIAEVHDIFIYGYSIGNSIHGLGHKFHIL